MGIFFLVQLHLTLAHLAGCRKYICSRECNSRHECSSILCLEEDLYLRLRQGLSLSPSASPAGSRNVSSVAWLFAFLLLSSSRSALGPRPSASCPPRDRPSALAPRSFLAIGYPPRSSVFGSHRSSVPLWNSSVLLWSSSSRPPCPISTPLSGGVPVSGPGHLKLCTDVGEACFNIKLAMG